MTSLEAIGNSHQAVSLRGDAKPVARAPGTEREQPVEKDGKTEETAKQPQAERAKPEPRGAHARLSYDQETKEVFVEILDPQTGEVLQRFPAEKLPDNIRASVGDVGFLVETIA